MRIAFMGTPELAAISLSALLESHHEVVAVVSQPDRPSGRGRKLVPTHVAKVARDAGLPLSQPDSVGSAAFRSWLSAHQPDISVVAAFGRILGPKLLALPPRGSINVHASLLPRWRGASPIQSAVWAGDDESGVTIMRMVRELDAGDMLHVRRTPIHPEDTAGSLHDRLAQLGAKALIEALDLMEAGALSAEPQDPDLVTFAPRIAKTDGDLNWQHNALELERQIRALHPWPGTRTRLEKRDLYIKVHPAARVRETHHSAEPGTILELRPEGVSVACGERSVLELQRLQAPGKRALDAGDFLSGFSLEVGERLR